MATMTARMSGMKQETVEVEGIEVDGFFVHLAICPNPRYKVWTVSHSRSGQNLGARFTKLQNALGFARDMAANYNGHCDPAEMFEQFRNRGEKPSCVDLAERNGMLKY